MGHDDPDLPGAPERHHDEGADGRFQPFRNAEIERLVDGHVEGDAGDAHGRRDAPERLWISL
jgi:hypothetical protein